MRQHQQQRIPCLLADEHIHFHLFLFLYSLFFFIRFVGHLGCLLLLRLLFTLTENSRHAMQEVHIARIHCYRWMCLYFDMNPKIESSLRANRSAKVMQKNCRCRFYWVGSFGSFRQILVFTKFSVHVYFYGWFFRLCVAFCFVR